MLRPQTNLQHRLRAGILLCGLIAVVVIVMGLPAAARRAQRKVPAKQMSVKELSNQKSRVRHEINQAGQKIKSNERELENTLRKLQSLDAEMAVTQTRVDSLAGICSVLSDRRARLESDIAASQREIERLRGAYLKQIKQMRLHRGETSGIAFLFSAKDFNQGLQRWRYMRRMAEWRRVRADAITGSMLQLQADRDELEVTRRHQTAALAQTQNHRRQLAAGHQQQNSLAQQLKADNQGLQQLMQRKRSELSQLDRQTSALIAAAQQQQKSERRKAEVKTTTQSKNKADKPTPAPEAGSEKPRMVAHSYTKPVQPRKTESTPEKPQNHKVDPAPNKPQTAPQAVVSGNTVSANSSTAYAVARGRKPRKEPSTPREEAEKPTQSNGSHSDFAAAKGHLPLPVSGKFRIVIPYGAHSRPDMPKVSLDNTGIDAEVSAGAPVKAVFAGKVAAIYKAQGFGTVVLLRHGDYYTVYANLASTSVKSGQKLNQGQTLGKVAGGDTPTLHFEVWKQRTHLNPSEWLR